MITYNYVCQHKQARWLFLWHASHVSETARLKEIGPKKTATDGSTSTQGHLRDSQMIGIIEVLWMIGILPDLYNYK